MSKILWHGKYFTITHTSGKQGATELQQEGHYEETLSLTALIHGQGKAFIEEREYSVESGDIILFGLNEIHSMSFVPDDSHDRISLYFSTSISSLWEWELPLTKIFSEHPEWSNVISRRDYSKAVSRIITQLSKLADQSARKPSALIEVKAHVLILELIIELYEAFEKKKSNQSKSRTEESERICKYIRDNLDKKLTYQTLEAELGVSRYTLSKIFREQTGTTITEYILQRRLVAVSSFIRNGKNLSEAVEKAGFENYSHFYKIFVKRHGINPKQYYSN